MTIVVEAVSITPNGSTMVAGRLREGNRPQVGERIQVVRTGKTGTIEDISIHGDDSAIRGLGIRVDHSLLSEETMRTSIGLRLSDITTDDVRAEDQIVTYREEKSETDVLREWKENNPPFIVN